MKKMILFFVLFLSACASLPPAPVVPPQSADSPTPTVIPSSSRIIDITTRNWAFSPASISAKKGEKVTIRLTGETGVHGFAVPDLGINQPVRPGETISVELPTDASGTFRFFCSIPCGQGHIDMKGTVVVEE